MSQMHTNANTELAKDYISKRKIPQLFEVGSCISTTLNISVDFLQALITGLMVHKPENHIEFIIESLSQVNTIRKYLEDEISTIDLM